jgi:nucleotide-binding universal stress UspA family protein
VAWPGLVQVQEEDLEAAKLRLETFNREQFANVADGTVIQAVCDSGDPAAAIIGFAESNDVDLIMMPTHGYGPFRSLLLGSVTAKVLHDAHCPVWTSAHAEDPDNEEHVPVRSIVCAVDTKKEDIGVLQLAKCVSKDEGAQLRIVHAYPRISVRPDKYLDQELEHDLAEAGWHEISQMIKEAGLDVPIIVEGGKVAEVVRNAVNRFDADLVIIGRGALHERFGRLRTNVYSIVRDSPRPVLSL